MAVYNYIAKDSAGTHVTGSIEAENEAAVVRALDDRKLFPVRVSPQGMPAQGGLSFSRRGVRLRDLSMAYGQLADLMRSGVPLVRSLETLVRSLSNPRLANMLAAVQRDVSTGKTLAESLAAHPAIFMPLHSAMIKAGERGGFLEDSLTHLADFLERQDELQSKVRGALIYPVVLTVIGGVVITAILMIMVPKIRPLFMGVELPAPTVLLFGLSDLLLEHTLLLAGMIVLAALGIRSILKSAWGRRTWGLWRLKLPVLGKLFRIVSITRFCRIMGTMLANGVPILTAMEISKDAAGCDQLSGCIGQAAESVRRGESLAVPLKGSGLFPAEIIEMIAIAEESNQMEKVLVQIADTVERRTTRQVDQAMRLIEPLILVMMALIIGYVAVGLLYPIFNMGQMFN